MMLIAALLAAGSAEAVPREVLLKDEAQVRELCAALGEPVPARDADPAQIARARKDAQLAREQALSREYRVEVGAKGFGFGRYRTQEGLLELDADRPLRALDGVLTLDVDGLDEVAFKATPEQVSQWTKEKKAGTLRLALVFRPSGERCAGSAAAQAYRLGGRSDSWQLVGSSGPVAAADADGEAIAPGEHAARIERVSLESDDAPLADHGRARLASAQTGLQKCAQSAPRSGSLVLHFSLEGGRVQNPHVVVDSLRDEQVAKCVSRAIAGTVISGASSGRGTATVALH